MVKTCLRHFIASSYKRLYLLKVSSYQLQEAYFRRISLCSICYSIPNTVVPLKSVNDLVHNLSHHHWLIHFASMTKMVEKSDFQFQVANEGPICNYFRKESTSNHHYRYSKYVQCMEGLKLNVSNSDRNVFQSICQ